jgi:adenosylcobinamide-phosphate synthase
MNIEYHVLTAVALDLVLGDPRWMPHPVKIMGRFALALEPAARRIIPSARAAGTTAALTVIGCSGLAAWSAVRLAAALHPWAADAVSILLIYTSVAARDLARHSAAVFKALEAHDLELAKERVSWIVGRDTENMKEEDVVRAAVESVAENTSDGVIAPLLYAFLFGPVGAIVYKAINTLDSTFGYKNERYIDFGWGAAKIDDLANWAPARITALLIAAAALLTRMSPRRAILITRRDGRLHASPNSGLSEAAMAGALGVQLGGPVWRKGKLDPMPFMGDPVNRVENSLIPRANGLMFTATAFAVAAGIVLAKGIRGIL